MITAPSAMPRPSGPHVAAVRTAQRDGRLQGRADAGSRDREDGGARGPAGDGPGRPAGDGPGRPAGDGPGRPPGDGLLGEVDDGLRGDDDELRSHAALPAGTHVQEYELLGMIGQGGFGVVYLAHDMALQRTVALKEYLPVELACRTAQGGVIAKSERVRARFDMGRRSFINEARMLARFRSPGLVEVLRFWEQNGTAYMAMPFYEGMTLDRHLARHPGLVSEDWLRGTFRPVFEALSQMHQQGCYHRDVAPDNILIRPDGSAILLDLGAARQVIAGDSQALTVMLKPGFAPIEQYADDPRFRQGAWTDVYALAAVFYYCITGNAPPTAAARVMRDAATTLAVRDRPGFSPSFLAIVDQALALQPEHRPQSIAEFLSLIDRRTLREPLVRSHVKPTTVLERDDAGLAGRAAGGPAPHGVVGGVVGGVAAAAGAVARAPGGTGAGVGGAGGVRATGAAGAAERASSAGVNASAAGSRPPAAAVRSAGVMPPQLRRPASAAPVGTDPAPVAPVGTDPAPVAPVGMNPAVSAATAPTPVSTSAPKSGPADPPVVMQPIAPTAMLATDEPYVRAVPVRPASGEARAQPEAPADGPASEARGARAVEAAGRQDVSRQSPTGQARTVAPVNAGASSTPVGRYAASASGAATDAASGAGAWPDLVTEVEDLDRSISSRSRRGSLLLAAFSVVLVIALAAVWLVGRPAGRPVGPRESGSGAESARLPSPAGGVASSPAVSAPDAGGAPSDAASAAAPTARNPMPTVATSAGVTSEAATTAGVTTPGVTTAGGASEGATTAGVTTVGVETAGVTTTGVTTAEVTSTTAPPASGMLAAVTADTPAVLPGRDAAWPALRGKTAQPASGVAGPVTRQEPAATASSARADVADVGAATQGTAAADGGTVTQGIAAMDDGAATQGVASIDGVTTADGGAATQGAAPNAASTPFASAPAAPAQKPGEIGLAVTPWAEVIVDGVSRGVTPPLSVLKLSPGNHVVVLKNPASRPRVQQVVVRSGRRARLAAQF